MKAVFQPEWRTQSRSKRRFYAKYMTWLERLGYLVVASVLLAFVVAFNYRVDDLLTADKVKIEPAASPITASQPTRVVALLAQDGQDVSAGQAVMEVAEGEKTIAQYDAWSRLTALRTELGASPPLDALLARYPRPSLRTLSAPATGTFRFSGEPGSAVVAAGEELARVVDYNDLRLNASLKGESVANARAGQTARIEQITVEPIGNTILRANAGGTPIVTSTAAGEKVKELVESELKGQAIRLRNDVPLAISGVHDVQIEAQVARNPAASGSASVLLDPPGKFEVTAEAIEGEAKATIQVSDLPAPLLEKVAASLRETLGVTLVQTPEGETLRLSDPKDVRMILKVKAESAEANGTPLAGTQIDRTYDATLRVKSPPAYLIQAVRQADLAGRAVTARVELRTGNRPIAFILLRKS